MKVVVDGIAFDSITLAEAVREALREGDDPCVVTTPNALMLQACLEDLRAVKENDPAQVENKEDLLRFRRKYQVYATDLVWQPE